MLDTLLNIVQIALDVVIIACLLKMRDDDDKDKE